MAHAGLIGGYGATEFEEICAGTRPSSIERERNASEIRSATGPTRTLRLPLR